MDDIKKAERRRFEAATQQADLNAVVQGNPTNTVPVWIYSVMRSTTPGSSRSSPSRATARRVSAVGCLCEKASKRAMCCITP
ncbi:hypothetical protein [Pseudomonas oryzihabitans]|uniref:hypothetical protein n=1 Tax=Pseudomonas oryzihabitans TaxID=47885 RepID=UPI001ABFB466|nr:hypothetical protein [Pseudomonas oryzihabitans]